MRRLSKLDLLCAAMGFQFLGAEINVDPFTEFRRDKTAPGLVKNWSQSLPGSRLPPRRNDLRQKAMPRRRARQSPLQTLVTGGTSSRNHSYPLEGRLASLAGSITRGPPARLRIPSRTYSRLGDAPSSVRAALKGLSLIGR
jgi:hypothetical protein